jgi:SNF2 family DNA or RNA helicase
MPTVHIERHGDNRILAKVPWLGGAGKDMAKQVPGVSALWDKTGYRDKFLGWTYPLDLEVCRQLRLVFGDMLEIGPELSAWAKAEVIRENNQTTLRMAGSAELPELAELAPLLDMAYSNRPFQAVGAKFALDGGSTLNADEPGLGKTLETLGALTLAHAHRVLVFCRKTALRAVWEREAHRWLGGNVQTFVCDGTRAQRDFTMSEYYIACQEFPDKMCILICNVEMVRMRTDYVENQRYESPEFRYLFESDWDAVVFDESHNALIGKSHLSVMHHEDGSKSAKISQTRLGAMRLPVKEGGLKLALSGTPFRGKVINMWGTLNWLRPDVFTSYWRYAKMYFEVEEGDYGLVVSGEDVRPDARAAFDRMLAPYVLRRTKAEVAKDLPPKLYAGTPLYPDVPDSPLGIWLPMESQQARAYQDMAEDARAQVGDGILMANGVLAELTRLKQLSTTYGVMISDNAGVRFAPREPSNKLNWILDNLPSLTGNEGKVIIASQFTQVINLFSGAIAHAGFPNYVITGETKQRTREDIVREFSNPDDEHRVVMINTKAGGESITLDAADVVIIIDETSIPDEQLQVEDRAHRVSREAGRVPVTVYYLRSLESIEADIAVRCGAREGACKEVLDGSRGVEIIRHAASHQLA